MSGNTVFLSPLSCMWDTTITGNGALNLSGNVTIYLAQTTTPANTYTANGGLVLNPNPIQVGSTGRLPNQIWQLQGQAIKGVLTDVLGNVLDTQDNCLGIADPSFASTQANNAFNTANAAYIQANTATAIASLANTASKNASNTANSGANTVATFANGTIVLANANLNFNNTSTINVSITANGTTQSNIAFSANTTALGVGGNKSAANGYAALSANVLLQWGKVQKTGSTQGTTVTFPKAFGNTCYSVTFSQTGGVSGANSTMWMQSIGAISAINFTVNSDPFGSSGPDPVLTLFWQAVGDV